MKSTMTSYQDFPPEYDQHKQWAIEPPKYGVVSISRGRKSNGVYMEIEVDNAAVYDLDDVIEGHIKVRTQKHRRVSKVFMDLVFKQPLKGGTLIATTVLDHATLLPNETIMNKNDTFTFPYSLTVPHLNPSNGSMLPPSVEDGSADVRYFLRVRVHYYGSTTPAEHFHRISVFPKYPKGAVKVQKEKNPVDATSFLCNKSLLKPKEYGQLTLKIADTPDLTINSTTVLNLQAIFVPSDPSDNPPEIKRLGYMLRALTKQEDFPLSLRIVAASTGGIEDSTLKWSFDDNKYKTDISFPIVLSSVSIPTYLTADISRTHNLMITLHTNHGDAKLQIPNTFVYHA
ncbi:hypothetical protein TRICI_002052 [Trichomonascus ciferrii]|uniref:Arrestin-like N-terminal domain-containing protein n=1 Tax=Trichomonascus ciferrii TaxID=44093 RepID=A0A642V6T1_9ASCO|nr:hypothetical protein TRICI_002052 [Trichomonascus ciferrii]